MSDAKKPMVVWEDPHGTTAAGRPTGPLLHQRYYNTDRPYLLLPIEDGALRVGDRLFRNRHGVAEYRDDDDPIGHWWLASTLDLWDLLMVAVEGVTE